MCIFVLPHKAKQNRKFIILFNVIYLFIDNYVMFHWNSNMDGEEKHFQWNIENNYDIITKYRVYQFLNAFWQQIVVLGM